MRLVVIDGQIHCVPAAEQLLIVAEKLRRRDVDGYDRLPPEISRQDVYKRQVPEHLGKKPKGYGKGLPVRKLIFKRNGGDKTHENDEAADN